MGERGGWDRYYLNRRDFVRYSLATTIAVWAGSSLPAGLGVGRAEAEDLFTVDRQRDPAKVFPQSVASGDPQPHGIVLWTRLNPKTARRGSNQRGRVAYEISRDENFGDVVLRGVVETSADRDYTVKTQLSDQQELDPFTTYYYRFVHQQTASRTGRFKTLPARDQALDLLRFGYTSCQDYTNGYYHALRRLAEEDLDYVVHLGDYIYETVAEESFQNAQVRTIKLPGGGERATSLKDYRFLYKTYKKDPDLQYLHERYAMINIWDDHEFANDCYRVFTTDGQKENEEKKRRENANRAWAEYVPAGVPYDPKKGPLDEIKIYRTFDFGNLARLVMTDERLYRDGPPCGPRDEDKYITQGCAAVDDPGRTMLGDEQQKWFLDQVTSADQTWKFWGNETMVMQFKLLNNYLEDRTDLPEGGSVYVNLDQWDGYQAERQQIIGALKEANVKNFVVLTGDLHSFIAGYLKEDFDDPAEVDYDGVCFMAGSVTSSNLTEIGTNGVGFPAPGVTDPEAYKASNPHITFFNSETHGYNVVEVTPDLLTCRMVSVNPIKVKEPRPPATPLRTFTVPRDQYVILGDV